MVTPNFIKSIKREVNTMKNKFNKKYLTLAILSLLLPLANSNAGVNVNSAVSARTTGGSGHSRKGEQLFFTDVFLPTFSDGLIERLNADGKNLKSLVSTGDGARGIAVDPVNGKIYWSDVNRHVISTANLDGKHQKDIVTGDLEASDLEIVVKREKIYWVDVLNQQIGRANLDGSNQTVLIYSPCGIGNSPICPSMNGWLAIDSRHKKLYWTTVYCSNHSCDSILGDILRSNLNGSNIETVVAAVGSPASIEVDPTGKKIYWADFVNDVIRRSNLDGTKIDDLFIVGKNNNPNSLALDLKNGYIYWDQDGDVPNRSCIKRMHLDGKHPEDVKCGFGNIADIEVVQKRRPRGKGY
jgi:sugar lactone lactonase YvrE